MINSKKSFRFSQSSSKNVKTQNLKPLGFIMKLMNLNPINGRLARRSLKIMIVMMIILTRYIAIQKVNTTTNKKQMMKMSKLLITKVIKNMKMITSMIKITRATKFFQMITNKIKVRSVNRNQMIMTLINKIIIMTIINIKFKMEAKSQRTMILKMMSHLMKRELNRIITNLRVLKKD